MSNQNVYESIMTGLREAQDDSASEEHKLKRHKVTVFSVEDYEVEENKRYEMKQSSALP